MIVKPKLPGETSNSEIYVDLLECLLTTSYKEFETIWLNKKTHMVIDKQSEVRWKNML